MLRTVITSEEEKTCTVVVPNNQLSLAIGNRGQNAKLAAKLTGYKIDIKPQTDPLTGEKAPELDPDFKVPEPVKTESEDIEELTDAAFEETAAAEDTAPETESAPADEE